MAQAKLAALKVSQVAARLQVSARTVHKLIERGQLRGIRVGRALRVPVRSLQSFLKNDAPSRTSGHTPVDREPLSAEDLRAIREGLAAIQRGETISLEELERKYRL